MIETMKTALKTSSRVSLCLILAFLMAFAGPLRDTASAEGRDVLLLNYSPEELEEKISFADQGTDNTAAANSGSRLYVSETVIETGQNPEKVKEALHSKGYCVYDQNLNEGAGGYDAELCSYLGYKVTFDKNKAITDLRLMDQDGGYDDFDYKAFLTGRFPGLAPTAQAMKDACIELGNNIEKGKTNALTAKEVLNSFCVPKESTELDGTPLCDYLTDPNRSLEDYKELLIVLNSAILDVINFQLAYGNMESEIIPTEIGKTGIVSRAGVIGYSGMTDAGNWLGDAAKKLIAGYDGKKEQAGLIDDYTDQIYLLRKALNRESDAPFTERAENWLKSVSAGCRYDAASGKPVAADGVSAYDFLSGASDLCLAAFFSFLPEVCGAGHFKDVIEICAYDSAHRLPTKLEYEYRYDTDWMNAVIAEIDGLGFDPYDPDTHTEHYHEVTKFSEEIAGFFTTLEYYFDNYEKAKERIEKDGVDNSSQGAMQEGEIFSDILAGNQEKYAEQSETDNDVLYAGTFALLTDFALKSKKTPDFASYLAEIVRLLREKTDDNDNEWTAMALTYPIIKALTPGQRYAVKTTPLLSFFANITAGETAAAGILAQLPGKKAELLEGIDAERLSVWFGTNKELIESETLSMTSQNVRRAVESGKFSAATSKDYSLTDHNLHVLVWFSVGTVIFSGVTAILFVVMTKFLGVPLTIGAIIKIGIGGIFGVTAFSAGMTAMCIIATVAVVVVIILVMVCLMLLIYYLIEKYEKKKPVYSTIPTIMLDCTEDENNRVLEAVRYDAVPDQTGMPADINCRQGIKWLALYYTKDPLVGSPLTCQTVGAGIDLSAERNASASRLQEIGEKCTFFGSAKGVTASDSKSESLTKFGQYGLYNLNANCFEDEVKGLYLWFFTEDSLAGIARTKDQKKYISEVTVAISKRDKNLSDPARDYILSMKGYFLLDIDLAPSNEDFAVYLGYATTDLEEEALRDIRVAYGNNAAAVTYGEVTYTNVLPGGLRFVPMKTCEQSDAGRTETPFFFQLYQAKTMGRGEDAAPPILAGSLNVVNSYSDIPDGCEPIALFGGAAYDFNSWNEKGEWSGNYDRNPDYRHSIVYYSTERPYKSTDKNAVQYLAGISFFNQSTFEYHPVSSTDEYYIKRYYSPTKYVESLGYKLLDHDLTGGIHDRDDARTNLMYCTTYNPYRAITDMGIFTAEPKSQGCPDNLLSGGVGFESCAVFKLLDNYYWSERCEVFSISYAHAYFTNDLADEMSGDPFLSTRAMYTAGYRSGVLPLKPADVVISVKDDVIPTASGANADLYFLDDFNAKRPVGAGLGKNWKTVHPLDRYYYDSYLASGDLASCFNLGLGEKGTCDTADGSVFNMFVRNVSLPNRVRGNYVLNANLVSSFEESASYDVARMAAMQMGEEIIGIESPISLMTVSYPDLIREAALYSDDVKFDTYGDGCILLSVSYTNSISSALGDIRIMEKAQGTTFPINISKQLENFGTVTYYYGNVAQLVGKSEYDEKDEKGRIRTSAEKAAINEQKPAVTLYTTKTGMKINRLLIQQMAHIGFSEENRKWYDNPNGAGDYFLKCAESEDVFRFLGYGSGTESYLCARRYDTGKEANYQYLSDISIITVERDDDSFRKASIALGSAGYPFILEYDLSGKTVGAGNRSVVIGTARTGSTAQAIKDLKFSYDDYGPTFLYHNVSYRRANDEPLRIEGLGNADVYIYFTRETGDEDRYTGVLLTWKELLDDETTDWANVDWTKVDINTIIYAEFSRAIHTPMNSLSWKTYERVTSVNRPGVDPLEYSIKNIGIVPAGAETKLIWAGASENGAYRKNDTNLTGLVEITTFDGSASPIRMMLKNQAGKTFDEGLSEYYAFLGRKSTASVIGTGAVAVLVVIGVGGAAFLLYAVKKKKKTGVSR